LKTSKRQNVEAKGGGKAALRMIHPGPMRFASSLSGMSADGRKVKTRSSKPLP
jgi:hypothetical protein